MEFADRGNLKSYAAQLDALKIELGCAFPDGRIFYLSGMSTNQLVRQERLSADDQRMFMN